ncbi:MAG: protein kinase [Bacteroidales bacterium]|nr:protein kinase [Bacteroidales bacterium]
MKKGDILNGYKILEDFKVAGGMSKISFAERGGKEYFIKEFLSPKYPTPDSPGSEKIKVQKRKACEEFEAHHRKINKLIGDRTGSGGNLVYAVAFFRNDTSYYKVNEKIDTSGMSVEEISRLPVENILIIAKSVCSSLNILHDLNIVHGDLKPDNILIKQTGEKIYTGKLIDFDDSYFSANPPKDKEAIVGTPEYYSPELATYIMDEDGEIDGTSMTLASDIFTFGIILTEYFTGTKPVFREEIPTWNAVNKGLEISFTRKLPDGIEELLRKMLSKNPSDRPDIKSIHLSLRCIKVAAPELPKSDGGLLRGKGIGIAKPKDEKAERIERVKGSLKIGKGLKSE